MGETVMNQTKQSRTYDLALSEATKSPPDVKKVLGLLRRSISEGDPKAAYALATWYLHGTNVKKNLTEAVKLLRKAADAKITDALYDLALCYEIGAGVKKSESRAYELYSSAAIWGDSRSFYHVGRCLFYGLGVKQERRLARIWLERAKALGFD